MTDHRLADHRADAEPAEHRHREVARCLGAAARRSEIADAGGRADEDRSLADALQRSGAAAAPTGCGPRRTGRRGCRGEQGADDHRRSQTVLLGEPAELRPDQHGSDAEGRQVEPDVDLVAAELFFDQSRQQWGHHADVDEHRQRSRGDQNERPGDHPLGRRRAQDGSLGRPSTRSPTMLRWIWRCRPRSSRCD